MRALSLDLRERIVAAYENNEGSHSALAARFSKQCLSALWILEQSAFSCGRFFRLKATSHRDRVRRSVSSFAPAIATDELR